MTDTQPLRTLLREAGYEFVEPAIVHDAAVFIDLAGEDLRRRMFLTSDNGGTELALRPDYTIPVCLDHLTRGDHRRRADYAYLGPVFRQRGAEPGEFLQAGVESLGRTDRVAADADILHLAVRAANCLGIRRPRIVIGDSEPFRALVKALDLSAPWQRRLMRTFGDSRRLEDVIETARKGIGAERKKTGLEGASRARVRRASQDMLRASGLATIDGRQADEIASRFVEKDALRRGIGDRSANILVKYLKIATTPEAAGKEIRSLARRHRLDLNTAADRFDKRVAAFRQRGIAVEDLAFAARFGRRLDYYTGFGFELYADARAKQPAIGGGRYDRLMSMLGAERAVPAIGFAIWLERTGRHT